MLLSLSGREEVYLCSADVFSHGHATDLVFLDIAGCHRKIGCLHLSYQRFIAASQQVPLEDVLACSSRAFLAMDHLSLRDSLDISDGRIHVACD